MRIQHNIMAMNAYRNYTNNVSALKGNLEKLSSGYKINRAGDDAAGLAISEKMRAQITGLQQAQNNAKSGINLVQTAEGALQEVQDMLNRMVKLAEQSANGTYDESVDRNQLQKEFQKLTDEIDRISDSANFNGIKLLNGDLAGTDATTTPEAIAITSSGTITENTTGAGASGTVDLSGALADGDTVSINGETYTYDATNTGTGKFKTLAELVTAAAGATEKVVLDTTDAGAVTATLTKTIDFSSPGTTDITIGSETLTYDGTNGDGATSWKDETTLKALLAAKGFTVGTGTTDNVTKAVDITGTWGGEAIAAKAGEGDGTYNMGSLTDNDTITINGNDYTYDTNATDGADGKFKDLATLQAAVAAQDDTVTITGTSLADVSATKETTTPATGGLKLQIGDTAHDYNILSVNIKSINSKVLVDMDTQAKLEKSGGAAVEDNNGNMVSTAKTLDKISVDTESNAREALGALKGMVNYISDIRGTLGATQNRLDHTINNLSVMTENIQDAESTIRDTDVAEEMMAYTKNNILIQSAQAMLAQANMVPQGVLQLLG